MHENGLIIPDFNSWVEFSILGESKGEVLCAGRNINIFPVNQEKKELKIRVHGVALSSMGKELYKVVDLEANSQYMNQIAKHLKGKGIRLEFAKLGFTVLLLWGGRDHLRSRLGFTTGPRNLQFGDAFRGGRRKDDRIRCDNLDESPILIVAPHVSRVLSPGCCGAPAIVL